MASLLKRNETHFNKYKNSLFSHKTNILNYPTALPVDKSKIKAFISVELLVNIKKKKRS